MSDCQAPLCLQSAMTGRVVWYRWSLTSDSCSKFSPLVSSFCFCRSLSPSRPISILKVSFCAQIDYLWIIHSQCLCRFLSLFLFRCLSYILSLSALFSKCPFSPPVFPLETSSPAAPQTEPGLSLSSYRQSRDRPSAFIYLVLSCRSMCTFEYLRWMKKGYFLKKCLCLLVFFLCTPSSLSKT